MEHLYAPWRSAYVSRLRPSEQKSQSTKECFLCAHLKPKNDEKSLIVSRQPKSFILLNLFPYNDGHLMIAPYRHIGHPNRLSQEEWHDMHESCRKTIHVLEKILKPAGFNIGLNLGRAAGAGVDAHVHLHVVPRWFGDTNFLPVIGKTKTISQDLKKLYKKLKSAF